MEPTINTIPKGIVLLEKKSRTTSRVKIRHDKLVTCIFYYIIQKNELMHILLILLCFKNKIVTKITFLKYKSVYILFSKQHILGYGCYLVLIVWIVFNTSSPESEKFFVQFSIGKQIFFQIHDLVSLILICLLKMCNNG